MLGLDWVRRRDGRDGGGRPKGPSVSARTLIFVILLIAAIVSGVAIAFFGYASANVENAAVSATNTNAQVEVHDLANIFAAKMVAISDNLQVLSNSPGAKAMNASATQPLLASAQKTTSNFTTAYSIFNSGGRPVASSNQTALQAAVAHGSINFSQEAFFKGAVQTGSTYTDPEYFSVSANQSFIVISQPVYSTGSAGRTFMGVITSGVSFTNLVRLITGQLAPQAQGGLGVVDYKGTVLYGSPSVNEGKNLFSPYIRSLVQKALPGQGAVQFYDFINASLSGSPPPSDFVTGGVTIALASAPVTYGQVLGNPADQRIFAAVYVTAPSTLAAGQAAEISQLQTFTGSSIVGVVGAAVVSSVVIQRRNRALTELVRVRTADLEKSLKTSELMQDILTHDIRNYNQASLSNIELLKEDLAGGSRTEDMKEPIARADSALKAIEGATNLVDKARTLGKIVSEMDVSLHPVDLGAALQGAVSLVVAANPGRSVKVTPRIQPGAKVVADELLGEAFANLISNSVRYTEGNEVAIEIDAAPDTLPEGQKDGYWKVTIADHGRGIAEELKSGLFARYLKSAHGSGLGLSIVYALVVERYSGELKVSDRVAGDFMRGTKVEVWLPKGS